MSKTTPGPWSAEHRSYGDEIWYGGEGSGMWEIIGPAGCYLAANDDEGEERRERSSADAALIAAAPELRDALRALVQSADCDHHSEPGDAHVTVQRKHIERARALLEKL